MGSESSEIFSVSAAGLDTSCTGNRWLSNVNVPELKGKSAVQTRHQRRKKNSTGLPDQEVDTKPIEFWTAKLFSLRGDCAFHDV